MNEDHPSISGRFPLKQAVISEATAASNEIVAAVASKSIRVISLLLVAAAAVDVTFEDGDGTDRTGPMSLAANDPLEISTNNGLFWTAPGQALNMLSSGIVQVSGVLTYVEVD